MKLRVISVAAALLLGASLAQSNVFGYWSGDIGPGVLDLGINLAVDGTPEEPVVLLDIPIQGMFDYPLTDVVIDGNSLSASLPGIPGDPTLTAIAEDDAMTGTFTQFDQDFELNLVRSEEGSSQTGRSQEPERPLPYLEEEVTVLSPAGDVTLAGTLTLPDGDGPFTAVLFLTGSGAQDRDESLFGHRPFLVLSDALTRAGYATLRFDDRGMGGSEGADHLADYQDMTADGVAGVEFLSARGDIEAIGLIGHSQGGYLAPLIAAEADVDFIISLAGPAVGGHEVLLLQNRLLLEGTAPEGTPPEVIEAAVQEQLDFLDNLIATLQSDDSEAAEQVVRDRVIEQLGENHGLSDEQYEQVIEEQVLANTSPAMAAFMTFDPQPSLRETTIPFLAVFGGLDVQVDAEQSVGPLEDALAEAGNEDVTIVVIDDMNHILQPAETGQLDEYPVIETTIHDEVFDVLLDWLGDRY